MSPSSTIVTPEKEFVQELAFDQVTRGYLIEDVSKGDFFRAVLNTSTELKRRHNPSSWPCLSCRIPVQLCLAWRRLASSPL